MFCAFVNCYLESVILFFILYFVSVNDYIPAIILKTNIILKIFITYVFLNFCVFYNMDNTLQP